MSFNFEVVTYFLSKIFGCYVFMPTELPQRIFYWTVASMGIPAFFELCRLNKGMNHKTFIIWLFTGFWSKENMKSMWSNFVRWCSDTFILFRRSPNNR